jgi:hypothetical protein
VSSSKSLFDETMRDFESSWLGSSSQRFMSTTNKAAAELNYYEVMGISRHATSDDIKKAYIERGTLLRTFPPMFSYIYI